MYGLPMLVVGGAVSDLDALFAPYAEKLSPEEAAEILGITIKTTYKYLKEGTIPAYRLGNNWIILREDLKAKLQEGSNQNRE